MEGCLALTCFASWQDDEQRFVTCISSIMRALDAMPGDTKVVESGLSALHIFTRGDGVMVSSAAGDDVLTKA